MSILPPVRKHWKLASPSPLATDLVRDAQVTPLQARILLNRGFSQPDDVKSFLFPRLAQMTDPTVMKGMDDAVNSIVGAVEEGSKITVYGDYDADGLTATALLATFLSHVGVSVATYVPDRLNEGYGLNGDAVKHISEDGTNLIITVDCGISDEKEVLLARRLGMDVVITDHHQLPPGFKAKCPVVNPHQPGCRFPFKDLSGVGLSFFLAVGLRAVLRKRGWFRYREEPDLKDYLDLAALGTIADRVPLLGQNRMLVTAGVARMGHSLWPGIRAIMKVAGVAPQNVSSEDLAYRVAPRLNAPGRMGNARLGLQLLMAENQYDADVMAGRMDVINSRRQAMEQEILDEAIAMIEGPMEKRRTFVLSSENWHMGVLGIVASRLVDRYHRPVLMAAVKNGLAVGSGRSIDGFDLFDAMKCISDCFVRFGGHYHAAGFRLEADRLKTLEETFEAEGVRRLHPEPLRPVIHVDSELPLQKVTPDVVEQLNALAPYGEGNPEPVFMARSVRVFDSRVVGERHLKLRLGRGEGVFDAIGFTMAERHSLKGGVIDLLFTPEVNRWQGTETIQLKIVDLVQRKS